MAALVTRLCYTFVCNGQGGTHAARLSKNGMHAGENVTVFFCPS